MAKRKSLTRRLLTSTLFVLTLSSGLPGCASNEPSAVVEKTPQEQETNATRFVNALFLQETAFLEEAVDLPFFYNQQALLSYPEEWEAVISRLKAQSQPAENFSVLEVKALSGGDVLALKPNIWAKLLEYEFDQYRYFIYRFHPTRTG